MRAGTAFAWDSDFAAPLEEECTIAPPPAFPADNVGAHRNKLDLLNLATVHRSTLELEDVPIKPTKPFYFSKVASFSLDSE